MTAAVILGGLALALLLPIALSAIRQPALASMALRNIRRRRGEAALVVAGALLGSAIITSAFVVGDVIEGAFADAARTELGPIDIILSPADGDPGPVDAAVRAADVAGLDGLLRVSTTTATLEGRRSGAAAPRVDVLELDLTAARDFGADPAITGIGGAPPLEEDEVLLGEATAGRLDAQVGDEVRLHTLGTTADVTVGAVLPDIGLAGYGDVIVAPGTLDELAADTTVPGAGPRGQLLVSLTGGVFDTRSASDAVEADLAAATARLPGVEVLAAKAAVIDGAAREGAEFAELFTVIGSFSVLAGALLLVNLFAMLAEERKTELGMLRAVGFTRRRLARTFAVEAVLYALLASALGTVVGVGIGWVVAMLAGGLFGVAEQGGGYPLQLQPASLALGASIGLVISLLTVWGTSTRIARLNIIRAIRDLPEPQVAGGRPRARRLALAGVLAGTALAVAGLIAGAGPPLLLGVPIAASSATPLLRRGLPERVSRVLTASAVLAWGLTAAIAFPDIMDSDDPLIFVVQGIVLTAGAVSLASSSDRIWSLLVRRLGARGLAPRLGIAYPLARRFRTSMLLAMFSLVIFTVTIISTAAATFERNTDSATRDVAAGFDVVLDANPANPIGAGTLAGREDVVAVAGMVRGQARFGADHLDEPRSWTLTGFDADLLAHAAPALAQRAPVHASDDAVYRAVLADPGLAIVPEGFLAGVGATELGVGDVFTALDPAGGPSRQLTVAALGTMDWIGNGALVSREVSTALLGTDVVSRTYITLADDADADAVARELDRAFLAHGAEATTFPTLVADLMRQQTGLLTLLQGFLGLGLLIGTGGLGVVMVRAVRERRKEIGMLRALGVRRGVVRDAMLSEAALIVVQGTAIGAALGLMTARQLLATLGDGMVFAVPWVGLAVILALPLAACLAATAWPASRAAAIEPAVALRMAG